jgi:hypothetical protein
MNFRKGGAKVWSVAATVAGLLFVTVLIAQVAPGGPFEWIFTVIHEWGAPDRGDRGPIR